MTRITAGIWQNFFRTILSFKIQINTQPSPTSCKVLRTFWRNFESFIRFLQKQDGVHRMLTNYLIQIYNDILIHQEYNIDFSIKKVEYIFNMWHFDNSISLVINRLPEIPRIGESLWIPYFKEMVGTDLFYVDSVDHIFNDSTQSVVIGLHPGTYNQYWQIRKGEAYLKGEISHSEFITSKDEEIRKKLGYRNWW